MPASRALPSLDLAGKTVLVLEDDFLISEHVKLVLTDHGAGDVHVVRSLEELRDSLFSSTRFDYAILDLRVGNDVVFADLPLLVERNVRFIFASGLNRGSEIPREWRRVPMVQKPYLDIELITALGRTESPVVSPLV